MIKKKEHAHECTHSHVQLACAQATQQKQSAHTRRNAPAESAEGRRVATTQRYIKSKRLQVRRCKEKTKKVGSDTRPPTNAQSRQQQQRQHAHSSCRHQTRERHGACVHTEYHADDRTTHAFACLATLQGDAVDAVQAQLARGHAHENAKDLCPLVALRKGAKKGRAGGGERERQWSLR